MEGKSSFRVDDGIHFSRNGIGSSSITDNDLYPLFVHEGSTPAPIMRNGYIIWPPDDTKPQAQKFSQQGPYIYWDYIGIDGTPHTLVFDTEKMGWLLDIYTPAATIHASNQRPEPTRKPSRVSGRHGQAHGVRWRRKSYLRVPLRRPSVVKEWMTAYELTIEYSSEQLCTVSFVAVDEGNESYAPNPVLLPSTAGQISKFTTKVSPSKWQLLQAVFTTSDPDCQIYPMGCLLSVKAWGSTGLFRNAPLFRPAGGLGGQL